MSRWHRRTRDERGALLVFVALTMAVLITSTALAVDIGQLTVKNRSLQAVADAVALDAARALNGSNAGSLSASSGAVTVAVQKSAARNNFPYGQLLAELGTKTGSAAFVPVPSGSTIPNAVRITANGTTDFAFVHRSRNTHRPAVAVQEGTAGLMAGSFLAGTTDEQDTVLNTIFGDSFHAQVLSYSGLANANVSLQAIGLNMPVTALSPTQLLSTSVSVKNLMLASAAALNDGSHTAAVSVLNALAASITTTTMINLGDTMIIEQGGAQAAANASVNVLQMLTAAAFVVDGTHAISIPAAQLSIPNVGTVGVSLNVLEGPKWKYGPVGTSVTTSQVQLTVTPHLTIGTSQNVNGCNLGATLKGLLTGLVGCLLGLVNNRLLSLSLNADIPISMSLAGAHATITNIACSSPQSMTITPELQALSLTSNVDLTLTGVLAGINLGNVLRIRGSAGAVSQSSPSPQVFLYPSQFGVPRTVTSTPLGLANLTNMTTSNVTMLNADLTAVLSPLTSTVLAAVNTALGQLDSVLVSPLNHLLGLGIGGADLTALGPLKCATLRLAE